MSTAHTPGPWALLTNGVCVSGPDPVNREVGISGVAHCGMARRTETENRANAQLVMAAPNMVEALRKARDSLVAFKLMPGESNAWEDSDEANLGAVDAALTLATGSLT